MLKAILFETLYVYWLYPSFSEVIIKLLWQNIIRNTKKMKQCF